MDLVCPVQEVETGPTQTEADVKEAEQQSCAPQPRRHCPLGALLRTRGAETVRKHRPSYSGD